MTLSRTSKVDINVTPFYHCIARCVRRTFLCGIDKESGKDFSHRKTWIVDRIKKLSSIFAIKVCAYAVMNNHYHVVIYINEEEALAWTDKEVITRWESLFPLDANQIDLLTPLQIESKIGLWRSRLVDISWFMKSLNEPIARASNLEDRCKGRFWEGRFKSQALLDLGALLSAMAYVDLNPIRAKVASTPETSEFTSIYERIQEVSRHLKEANQNQINTAPQPIGLIPFSNENVNEKSPAIEFTLSDYLQLVDETGRILRKDKKGAISQHLSPILSRLQLTAKGWLEMVNHLEERFFYAIGNEHALLEFRSQYRTKPPRGIIAAKYCYWLVA